MNCPNASGLPEPSDTTLLDIVGFGEVLQTIPLCVIVDPPLLTIVPDICALPLLKFEYPLVVTVGNVAEVGVGVVVGVLVGVTVFVGVFVGVGVEVGVAVAVGVGVGPGQGCNVLNVTPLLFVTVCVPDESVVIDSPNIKYLVFANDVRGPLGVD